MDLSGGGNAGTVTTQRPRGAVHDALPAFVRFVVLGGGTGLAAGGLLMALSGHLSLPVANALVSVLCTVVATELHHRFTFARGRASRGWAGRAAHVGSAGTALAAYLFTTAAMLGLAAVRPSADLLTQQAVYLGASGLAGIGRFVLLRGFVFAVRTTAVPARRGSARVAAIARATGDSVSVRAGARFALDTPDSARSSMRIAA
jgi:putative flippase GtrA